MYVIKCADECVDDSPIPTIAYYPYTSVEGLGWFHEVEQVKRDKPKIGRNALCPCGSGKKFKKCCWKKEV